MPFCYKSIYSLSELNKFLASETGQAYIKEFNLKKKLILFPKGQRHGDLTYLVTDVELFPVDRTPALIKSFFEPQEQDVVDEIGYNLYTSYEYEGEIRLLGGDDFDGEPPILGYQN